VTWCWSGTSSASGQPQLLSFGRLASRAQVREL
jgi:hypothetical protein